MSFVTAERLESRTLLSAANLVVDGSGTAFITRFDGHLVVVTSNNLRVSSRGTLLVQGTTADDQIRIDRIGDTITASLSVEGLKAITQTFAASDVKRIYVDADGGDDQIRVSSTVEERATLLAGSGDDLVIGSGSLQTIKGGSGDDVLFATDDAGATNRSSDPAYIQGGTGDDIIRGTAGLDTIVGGAGRDLYRLRVSRSDHFFIQDVQSETEIEQISQTA
jgi:Ca2+-binding RTX toxin-like protein